MASNKAKIAKERPTDYQPTLGDEYSLTAIVNKVCLAYQYTIEYVIEMPITVLATWHEQAIHKDLVELYNQAYYQTIISL